MVRYIISTSDEFYNKKEISAKKWSLSVKNKKKWYDEFDAFEKRSCLLSGRILVVIKW